MALPEEAAQTHILAPHVAQPPSLADVRWCHCHACTREVLAFENPDAELVCPRCQGTCLEIIEAAPARPQAARAVRVGGRRRRGLTRHFGVICDGCQVRDFPGTRHRCLQCPDYDLCGACYSRRDSIHPGHTFEATVTPQPLLRSLSGLMVELTVTNIEIHLEGEDGDSTSGLEDSQVAWWLGQDQRLLDMDRADPDWTCPICSEGAEAEGTNGWLVRICNEKCPDGEAASSDGDVAQKKEPEQHIFHEGCLRKWLCKKNSCPVCRHSPVVPPHVAAAREGRTEGAGGETSLAVPGGSRAAGALAMG